MSKVLVIGALGQVGQELVFALREKMGVEQVVASDVRLPENPDPCFEVLDVMNKEKLHEVVKQHNVKQVYLLAALLSANAEKNVDFAWRLNMEGLFNVLNLAKEKVIDRIFWPSSIAIFGPTTPKVNTPQNTIAEPNTVYGISKLAGERWCEYYHDKYQVDVRSIRYPGLIGYKSLPGGGTTDYAVDIFHHALKSNQYTCFLGEETTLPMMYMPDAIKATLDIMNAQANDIKIRSSYNIAGLSFSPREIAEAIAKVSSGFSIDYAPDFRQKIADSWPQSIDDGVALADWGWKANYDLDAMVKDMMENLKTFFN
jgi:nucleoside-diphosphate-sugar epimerase